MTEPIERSYVLHLWGAALGVTAVFSACCSGSSHTEIRSRQAGCGVRVASANSIGCWSRSAAA